MKFVIHLSPLSQLDAHSTALINALCQSLDKQGHDFSIANSSSDTSFTQADSYRPLSGEQHLLLVTDSEIEQVETIKSCEYPPLILYTSMSIPQQMARLSAKLPDITVVPDWKVQPWLEEALSGRDTALIKLPALFYDHSDEALASSKLELSKQLTELESDFNGKKMVAVFLDGDLEDERGELISTFDISKAQALADKLSADLITRKLANENTAVMIIPGLTSGLYFNEDGEVHRVSIHPHLLEEDCTEPVVGLDYITIAFAERLMQNLAERMPEECFHGIKYVKGAAEPQLAVLELMKEKGGLIMVPKSDETLLAQAASISGERKDIVAYSAHSAPTPRASILHEGGFISSMEGQFAAVSTPKYRREGCSTSKLIEPIATQVVSKAEKRPCVITVPSQGSTPTSISGRKDEMPKAERDDVADWKSARSASNTTPNVASNSQAWDLGFWAKVSVATAAVGVAAVVIGRSFNKS